MCKILVTGANGFLGREIVCQLQVSGLPVYATDIGSTSSLQNIAYRKADIRKPEDLRHILENTNIVIHAAGLAHIFSPKINGEEQFRQINEIGTANVASLASNAGIKHFILISSVSVYGPYTLSVYNEDTPCNPFGPYALSKYNAELRAIEIAQKSGMALTILRLATLYGEGDPGNVGRLTRAIDRSRFLWIGDGSNRKSLLYKEDAARACMAVLVKPASGINIYNVSAPPCTMYDIVDGISVGLGKRPLPVKIPASPVLFLSKYLSLIPCQKTKGFHQTIKKWLAEDVYDTSKFEKDYGFQTKNNLQEGLKREVNWYLQNKFNTK